MDDAVVISDCKYLLLFAAAEGKIVLLGAVEGGYSFKEVEHRFIDLSEVGLVYAAQIDPPDLLQFIEEEVDRGLEGRDYRNRVAKL